MPTQRIMSENRQRMEKAAEFLQTELRGIRTGRASPGLVDNLKADYYGNPTPLKQLATIAVPQVDMIVIKPFDPASLKDIEKAIKNSELSIAPLVDGKIIRLNVPPLSEERRQQLVSQVKRMAEQAKVSVRNIRRETIKQLEQEQKAKNITEDELEKGKKDIDNITKEITDNIDSIVKAKSEEIMLD
jgi:ribosome recycling factor